MSNNNEVCVDSDPVRALSTAHTQLIIDLSAVKRNLDHLQWQLGPETRLMAILKAEGYGTNALAMARFLGANGVDIFGLAYVDEAVRLRQEGIKEALFIIHAAPYEASHIVQHQLEVAASDKTFIDALAAEASLHNATINVHLHVNTGMNRFGCSPDDALALARHIRSYPYLNLVGIMTHFAASDDPRHDSFTETQAETLLSTILSIEKEGIPLRWRHAANSSAALRFCLPQFNMARIGIGLYGLHVSETCRKQSGLECAITLRTRIIAIDNCPIGETVSYGRTYTVKGRDQKIAIVPIGYHDGIHRHYSGKAFVVIRGQKAPMVGRICMDYMMIDVTDIPDAAIGDTVQIFGGDAMNPESFALCGGTIAHEVMACLGPRIQRLFLEQ